MPVFTGCSFASDGVVMGVARAYICGSKQE